MADGDRPDGRAGPTERDGSCDQPLTALPPNIRSRIEIDLATGCWFWTGNVSSRGYGRFQVKDAAGVWRNKQAHRLVYELLVGDPGENLHHQPTCPKRCVNPEHLTPMTISAHVIEHNVRDACKNGHPLSEAYTVHCSDGRVRRMCAQCEKDSQRRQRQARKIEAGLPAGDRRAKLTGQQRDEIRSSRATGERPAAIAARYGVSEAHVFKLTSDIEAPGKILRRRSLRKRRLTDDQVREVRRRYDAGEKQGDLGAEFGVGRAQIGYIVRRQVYADVT